MVTEVFFLFFFECLPFSKQFPGTTLQIFRVQIIWLIRLLNLGTMTKGTTLRGYYLLSFVCSEEPSKTIIPKRSIATQKHNSVCSEFNYIMIVRLEWYFVFPDSSFCFSLLMFQKRNVLCYRLCAHTPKTCQDISVHVYIKVALKIFKYLY